MDETKWILRSRRVLAAIFVALPPLLSLIGAELPEDVREKLGGSLDGAAYLIGWGIAAALALWRRLRPDPRTLRALPRVDTGGAGKLGLALVLLLPLACATPPAPQSARQAYAVALTAYTSAALAMAEWCAPPERAASETCEGARTGARAAQAALDEVSESIRAGTVTDAQYERAADRLTALAAILRASHGGTPL